MSHKTKAAMQGRQCHYQKLKQSQDTRVNAGGQSLSAPVISGTAPLARFGGMSKSGHSRQGYTNFSAYLQTTHKLGCLGCTALAHTPFPQIWGELDQRTGCTAMQHTKSPKISGDTITEIVIVGLRVTAGGHTTEKSRSFDRYPDIGYRCKENCIGQNQSYKNSGGNTPEDFQSAFLHFGYQPFGSIPCRRNSSRANSFNQLPRLTPLRSAASLSCCRNSGVIRIWKVGDSPSPFGVLSRLIVDMYVRNLIAWILLCTYVITTNMQKTTPRTAGTVPGRLTSTDKLRIEEAMKDHITHPQGRKSYIWRFLALSAIGRNVIHITATTEREAREQSPAGCVMVFAGRLPVEGMVIPTPPFIHCEYRNTSTVEKTSMEVSHA